MSSCNGSRPFSQEIEMSQMTCSLLTEQSSAQSGTMEEGNHSQAADAVPSQQDSPPEEHLSSRANSIVEQNRQINTYVMKNLKQLEKKRLNLINKKKCLEVECKNLEEIKERQRQTSVELQMNHEETTEQFQNEFQRRPQLYEKLVKAITLYFLHSLKTV